MAVRLSTEEVLSTNNKIETFVIVRPESIDPQDVDLFVVVPPPETRDPSHQAPVRSATHLCGTCRGALGYLSYHVGTQAAGGSGSGDADAGGPRAACLLHDGAAGTLRRGEAEGCHLCVLLASDLRAKRLSDGSVARSRVEMCWQADLRAAPRLHLALTHGGHARATDNYWNFLKLRLWPCAEHGAGLFAGGGGGGGGGGCPPGIERSGSTGSRRSRDLAVGWLSVCQADEDGRHGQCNQGQGGWLPTRLLDVAHAREAGKLRLVLPRDHPDEFALGKQYLTLSHCWGAWGSVTLPVLTVENLSERQTTGLDLSFLPKTFKEALDVAEWFKCRWLWIDSLCIIQDSTDDWQREAAMMYSVYKGALLNISADDSNDARWGCFRDRDPLAVCPMRLGLGAPAPLLPQDDSDGTGVPARGQGQGQDHDYWLTPDTTGLFEAVTEAPLARRAWVFQERQLSRRVLHFTSREVIWECCAEGPYFACETFPRGFAPSNPPVPPPSLFGGRPKYQGQGLGLRGGGSGGTGEEGKNDKEKEKETEKKTYETWDMLCQSYSEKKLSHAGDKAVALSGLAREFEALLPRDTYVAGMWRSLLPQSLLWRSAEASGRVSPDTYVAPSWSWLSIDGPVSDLSSRATSLPVMEVLGIAAEPVVPSEPTASLRGAHLDLRCYLRPVEIRPDYQAKPWYMMAIGGGKNHKLAIGDGGTEVGSFDPLGYNGHFNYSLDLPSTADYGPSSVSAYFLPVSIDGPDDTFPTGINGLLVEAVGSDLTTFTRVGIMSCHGPHCLPILYRARDVGDMNEEKTESTGQWNRLRGLLGESYKSWKSIRDESRRQKSAGDSPVAPAPLDDSSPSQGSSPSGENEPPGITSMAADDAAKTSSGSDGDKTTTSTGAEVDMVGESMANLHVSGENKTLEPPVPIVNWESFEALERLYASDGKFIGSELERHFGRMVPTQIRLI